MFSKSVLFSSVLALAMSKPIARRDHATTGEIIPLAANDGAPFDMSSVKTTLQADSSISFNDFGGLPSLHDFDAFYGPGNYCGAHNPQIHTEVVICHQTQVTVIQQHLAIVAEYAKKVILTQSCETEAQVVLYNQWLGNLVNWGQNLRRVDGATPTFDSNVASKISQVVDGSGNIQTSGFDFTGTSIGEHSVKVAGGNWNDYYSPASVKLTWEYCIAAAGPDIPLGVHCSSQVCTDPTVIVSHTTVVDHKPAYPTVAYPYVYDTVVEHAPKYTTIVEHAPDYTTVVEHAPVYTTVVEHPPVYYPSVVIEHEPAYTTIVEHPPKYTTVVEHPPKYTTVAEHVPEYTTVVEHNPVYTTVVEHAPVYYPYIHDTVVEHNPIYTTVVEHFPVYTPVHTTVVEHTVVEHTVVEHPPVYSPIYTTVVEHPAPEPTVIHHTPVTLPPVVEHTTVVAHPTTTTVAEHTTTVVEHPAATESVPVEKQEEEGITAPGEGDVEVADTGAETDSGEIKVALPTEDSTSAETAETTTSASISETTASASATEATASSSDTVTTSGSEKTTSAAAAETTTASASETTTTAAETTTETSAPASDVSRSADQAGAIFTAPTADQTIPVPITGRRRSLPVVRRPASSARPWSSRRA